ncbi:MAG: division/cell wall cluster transcriptional repressor MraZ [Gammaproteobacteria bacterium]
MFRGVNALNLDAKGRMAIPTRYRERLNAYCEGHLIITVDRDRCLLLYPLPDWEVIERKLNSLPNLDKQTRRLQRLLVGHATECDMDGSSRILLPPPLREFAMLDKHVVLIGQGNKFELWDESTWNEKRDRWLASDEDDESLLPSELETISL